MSTITFSSSRQSVNIEVTPLLGSVILSNSHIDNPASPSNAFNNVRLGVARDGECLVRIDDSDFTMTEALSLVSTIGLCDFTVTGDDIQNAVGALIEVNFQSQGIKLCKITWKGTKAV